MFATLSRGLFMVWKRLCQAVFLCVFSLAAFPAAAQGFTSVVVFGDSLSDTGNIAHITNADFGVTTPQGEKHGVSILLRDGDSLYRSYFTGARGVEHLGSHWTYLDLTPWGRQETWEDSPKGWPQTAPYSWMHRHDEYGD